ncbi:class I SAM-dependent methyltransferase [Vibrio salinus]|uniref:class I SAM-dependent methyltransferase n=1 Tax=Vibrio salinus TaxID=2899784 RepID=UPI001E2B6274|nr:class I SAM-dependent methyltransferase [Vibrio salinus]MCE0492638.1 class I SAM-dependent methyltransferase [Vibrio salinus]
MNKDALGDFISEIVNQLPHASGEVRRLFHGRGRWWPGLEQLTADWIDNQLVVAIFKEQDDSFLHRLKQALNELAGSVSWGKASGKAIIIQYRYQSSSQTEVITGDVEWAPIVTENGLKYQMSLGKNQNSGLFLDMRLGRDWVQKQSHHCRVLNLFSYTCGFSVAAIEGGASVVVNVDMSKPALSVGRENHRLNGHDLSKVKFLPHDIFKSWGKIRKNGPYDLIIIDPPSFQKGSFALTSDYKKILKRLSELLSRDGTVLACVNSPSLTSQFLIEQMAEYAPDVKFVARLDNPAEFSDIDPEAALKVMVFR